MTLNQLAKAVGNGYTRQTAYYWESKAENLSANLLGRIAEVLGADVSAFYFVDAFSSSKKKRVA